MPSQPRWPTRRENSGTSLSSRLGLCGSKVPAAISSARKARTSLRNLTHSGGKRIGSKRRAAVILEIVLGADVLKRDSIACVTSLHPPLEGEGRSRSERGDSLSFQ